MSQQSGGGAAIGLGAALLVKKKFEKNAQKKKKQERANRQKYLRTGGKTDPRKKKTPPIHNSSAMSKGMSGLEKRMYGLRVQLTSVGDNPSEAIGSAIDCSRYIREVHVILATSHKKGNLTHALEQTYGGNTAAYDKDMKNLENAKINLVIHTRYFNESKISQGVLRLVDASGLTEFTEDQFDEWLQSRVALNYKKRGYRDYTYSMKSIVDEGTFTWTTPLIVALMVFNYLRAILTQFGRTQEGVDLNMSPVRFDESGGYVPQEYRMFGFLPRTGWVTNRDRRLVPVDGPRTILPDEWSGWQRLMWLCQRQDRLGLGAVIFGFWLYIYVFTFPYWNVLIPWLAVDVMVPLRIGLWVIHSIIFLMALPYVYDGPLSNLVVVFLCPFVAILLPFIMGYGMLLYKGSGGRGARATGRRGDDKRKRRLPTRENKGSGGENQKERDNNNNDEDSEDAVEETAADAAEEDESE